MSKKTLLEQTFSLLGKSKTPAAQICRELGFSQRWYYDLMSGDIKDPGVNRIQRLHDYLSQADSKAA